MSKRILAAGVAASTAIWLMGSSLVPFAGAAVDLSGMSQAELLDLLADLQALIGGDTAAECYTFTRDLTLGATGADVTALQDYLTPTYFTFSGGSTGYFGPITQSAVAAWQAANGVAPAAGYWGPISRAKYDSVCTPAEEEAAAGDFFEGDDEGNLAGFDQISSLANEEVGEDEEDISVLGFEIEADGADQMIQRVTVEFNNPSDAAEDDLDDFITEVSVWLGGDELGRLDVDDASYDRADDLYTFRFNGLEGIIEDDDALDLEVAVSAVGDVNGDIDGEGWDVNIASMRAASPNGTDEVYDDTDGTAEAFTLETYAAATNLELKARRDSDSPEEGIVVGQDDDEFEADLLVFTLEAINSDITVYSLEFDIASAPATVDTDHMAQELILDCEGDTWTEAVPDAGAQADDIVFDDLDVEIEEDDTISCTVSGTMNEIDGVIFEESASMSVDLDVSETDAEDAAGENLAAGDLTGSANGYDQTFISEGPVIDGLDADADVTFIADEASETAQGTFIIEFDVTAYGTDVWLDRSLDNSGDGGNDGEGIVYTATSSDAEDFTELSATYQCVSSCGSSADNSATDFFVGEDDTETYRLTVVLEGDDTPDPGNFKVWIDSINWATADATADQFYTTDLGEESDADTGWLYLDAKA